MCVCIITAEMILYFICNGKLEWYLLIYIKIIMTPRGPNIITVTLFRTKKNEKSFYDIGIVDV